MAKNRKICEANVIKIFKISGMRVKYSSFDYKTFLDNSSN